MTSAVVTGLLQQAVGLHQAGRLAEAEQLYDRVLSQDRANADALNLKGVIAEAQGRRDVAVALFERASAARPAFPEAHFNRANALAALERFDEAVKAYGRAVALRPSYADARLNAALLLRQRNRHDDALSAFRAMVQNCPNDPRAHYGLATSLASDPAAMGEASKAFERALDLAPGDPMMRFSFANFLAAHGSYGEAIAHVQRALKIQPDWPEALSNLGEWLKAIDHHEEAVTVQRQALALRPADPGFAFNLADALIKAKQTDEAEALFLKVIADHPDFVRPYVNLGNLYRDRNRLDDALNLFSESLNRDPTLHQSYSNMGAVFADKGWRSISLILHDKAISLKQADPGVRFNRAVSALQLGLFTEAWGDYERRFEVPKEYLSLRPVPPAYWGGEDLVGKRILIWTEQGVGDEILHGSFVPEIAARAAHCVLECSARMAPIFARSFPGVEVVARADYLTAVTPASAVDYQISIASLGQYLRPDFASFPKHAGYLKADPVQTAACRARYDAVSPGQRLVGLAWRSKNEKIGAFKSLSLMDLAPILQVPGLTFVNLQYGDCAAELAEVKAKLGVDIVQDPAVDPLKDMDAAFAQVAAMDLVISTSNTTVHTAGALNVPVWLMLPYAKGTLWYWFVKRPDSPWYPSARLIREAKLTPDRPWWQDVVARSAADLAAWKKQS